MTDYLATVSLANVTGMEEDRVVNTFAIGDVTTDDADTRDDVANALIAFYNAVPAGGLQRVSAWLGHALSRAANVCRVSLYDITGHLDGSPHGSPIYVETFTLGAAIVANAFDIPSECAVAVTLEAANRAAQPVERPDGPDAGTEVDRPRQRYTGRLYLGPFNANALSGADQVRPDNGMLQNMRMSIDDLVDALDLVTGAGGGLGVWSRKDAVIRRVTHVSTDNAWDTQRRRGLDATLRTRLAV